MKDVKKIFSAFNALNIREIFTDDLIRKAIYNNVWFTEDNIAEAIKNLESFIRRLSQTDIHSACCHTVAVVMNGMTPLESLYDLLIVIVSGNKFVGKLSPDDNILVQAFVEALISAEPEIASEISFVNGPFGKYDAIILSGNRQNCAVLENYLAGKPHLIHVEDDGIQYLKGDETEDELEEIAKKCFVNFGRGDGSVRNLFVPQGYDFKPLLSAFAKWEHIRHHARYFNNYEYWKSACIIGKTPCIDNGFVILRKSGDYNPHVGEIFYHEYESLSEIMTNFQKKDMTGETMEFLKNL